MTAKRMTMTQLLIRDLTPDTVERLKLRAKQHHRSLQAELKHVVETAAKMTIEETRQVSHTWHKRLKGRPLTDSAKLLREDRDK